MAFNQYSVSLIRTSSQDASITNASQTGLNMGSGNLTISGWIKMSSTPSADNTIAAKGKGGAGGKRYYLYVGSGGIPIFQIDDDTTLKSVSGSTTITTGKWFHIAGVRDGNNLRIYVNGTEDASATDITGYGSLDDTADFRIGSLNGANYIDGQVDNVMVYSDARSEAEIQADMFDFTPSDANLQGHWDLENDYVDSSGNGNNLTANNSPVFSTNVPWTGANSTDWSNPYEIQSDSSKVSGSTNLTDFPALIADGNLSSAVYTGTAPVELNDNFLSDPNLKAYYRFNSGALTTDSSGNSRTLTNFNSVGEEASGKFGYCADFGTSDADKYLHYTSGMGETNNVFSISLWVKLRTEISTGTYSFIQHSNSTKLLSWEIKYEYNSGTRRLTLSCYNGSSTTSSYNITLGTSDWYQITLTSDGTTAYLYLDGIRVASISVPSSSTWPGGNYFSIGGNTSVNNAFTYIDDVAFFNRTLSKEEIRAIAQGGHDLRITTDSAGTTEVPFEIVSLDTTAETCEIWAKVPTLSYNSSTSLFLWYGNSSALPYSATDTYGSQNVWSDYEGVWHLEGNFLDSSANGYNLTEANTPTDATGKIANAKSFDSANSEYAINTSPTNMRSDGDKTVSFWVYLDSLTTGVNLQTPEGLYNSGGGRWWTEFNSSGNLLGHASNIPAVTSSNTISTGEFAYVVHRLDSSNNTVFLNTTKTEQAVSSSEESHTSSQFAIGKPGSYAGQYFDGRVDELKFSTTAFSDDWIATEYNNQNSPSTFWTPISGRRIFVIS